MALDPREIYYGIGGQRYGPVAVDVVRTMIAAGRLGPEDHLWDPDLDDWVQAKRYPGLLAPPPVGSDPEAEEPPIEAVIESEPWIMGHAEPTPASFFRRLAAYVLDAFVLVVPAMIWISQSQAWFGIDLQAFVEPDYTPSADETSQLTRFMYITEGIFFLLEGIYHAVMESSHWQATFGKRALGIVVTDERGQRISFLRALGRHFGRLFCNFSFQIGYLLMLFSEKGQGLHDRVARTMVLRRR